jgi:hypothetical protein
MIGVFAFASFLSTHVIAASEKEAIKKCDIDAFREFTHADKATKLRAIIDFGKCIKTEISRLWGATFATSKIESE